MALRLLGLALVLVVVGCTPVPSPNPPPIPIDGSEAGGPILDANIPEAVAPVPPSVDAAPAPADVCAKSYAHLVAIGCTPRPPVSGSWVDVCRHDRPHGAFALKPLDNAKTVAQAKAAGADCLP
jgi:hypothetical protein